MFTLIKAIHICLVCGYWQCLVLSIKTITYSQSVESKHDVVNLENVGELGVNQISLSFYHLTDD